MAQLLSVNVGLPRKIEWKGKTVRTAVSRCHRILWITSVLRTSASSTMSASRCS
jgi:hypothetical protein